MTIESSHASDQPLCDINVTPLIDVLLVMLIVFMVIAPVLPYGLNASLPQRSINPNPKPETPVVVQIMRTGNGPLSYKINRDDVSIDELGNRLSSILSTQGNKSMFVKGDGKLDFAAVAKVMDIGRGAGADRIGLLTSKRAL